MSLLNEVIQLLETARTASGFVRFYSESINIVETTNFVRILKKIINNTVNMSETLYKAWSKRVNEVIQVAETKISLRGMVRLVTESVSIQTFREKIRALIRTYNESVSIGTSLAKNLQDGLVRITRTLKINRRNRSTKSVKRDQSTRIHRSGSEKTYDKDKDVKTYKRDGSIKGEDT